MVPLLEFGGGELGGLFLAPPPPIETFVVLCCVMVDICVLIETIIVTSTWVVCVNGHTFFWFRIHHQIPHHHLCSHWKTIKVQSIPIRKYNDWKLLFKPFYYLQAFRATLGLIVHKTIELTIIDA
jgi:hypothetical protein